MDAPVLTFFNNKGGVGKTSLVYHLAWMFADLGKRVLVVDLDPQANLTAAFLTDDQIEPLWDSAIPGSTLYQCVRPLAEVGDILSPSLQQISPNLFLLPGDVQLSSYEETLSEAWPRSLDDQQPYRAMRILSSFWHVIKTGSESIHAEVILIDVGPNLGAINRSALIATDFVVIPLGADLFSLQGLKNLGPALRSWNRGWKKRIENWKEISASKPGLNLTLPSGNMIPIGYLCQQHGVRLNRPVKAYDKWIQRVPSIYRKSILNNSDAENEANDPYCLATVKHYRSLIPLAQEHRKPIFHLTNANGAIGSHASAVQSARADFNALARKIAEKIGIAPV